MLGSDIIILSVYSMHLAKLLVLLLGTLVVMRACSWFFLWLMARLAKAMPLWHRVVSNAFALFLYLGILILDRLPGELMDARAAVFGLAVYAVFALCDLKWLPSFVATAGRTPCSAQDKPGQKR